MRKFNNNLIAENNGFGVNLAGLREVVVIRVISVVIIIPN